MGLRWKRALGVGLLLLMAMPLLGAAATQTAPADEGQKSLLTEWVFPIFDYLVLSLLGLASVAGIAIAIDAMMHIRESKIAPAKTTEHLRRLIAAQQYKELMDFTATDTSFVSRALYAGIRRAYLKYAAMREALETSVGEQTSDLFRRIEPLNVIGNIGPLLGLLGTVLGMIMAFYQLKQSHGTPKVEDLSMGISAALWHTFFGLFVAIPCLVVYGFYRTRADKIAMRAALVAEELLEALRPEPAEDKKKARLKDAPSPQPQGIEG